MAEERFILMETMVLLQATQVANSNMSTDSAPEDSCFAPCLLMWWSPNTHVDWFPLFQSPLLL